MKHIVRRTEYKALDYSELEVNDVITFVLNSGETVEARVMTKPEENTALLCLVDCLEKGHCMHSERINIVNGWADTKLRSFLNTQILNTFPEEIRSRMLPVFTDAQDETGDLLRLPTELEIFGLNLNGRRETVEEGLSQWPCMRERRARKTARGYDGIADSWYWLINTIVGNQCGFCLVDINGVEATLGPTANAGLRLVFKIKLT